MAPIRARRRAVNRVLTIARAPAPVTFPAARAGARIDPRLGGSSTAASSHKLVGPGIKDHEVGIFDFPRNTPGHIDLGQVATGRRPDTLTPPPRSLHFNQDEGIESSVRRKEEHTTTIRGRFLDRLVRATCSMTGMAVIALALAVSGEAQAACEMNERISHRDSDCLTAEWTNRTWPNRTELTVKSECQAYGKVVAKIDVKNASDLTWHLNNGVMRRKMGFFRVREVSCCSDLSDLCNASGMVTHRSCLERFQGSSADESCRDATGTAIGDSTCTITAQCETRSGYVIPSHITTSYRDVAGLHNCGGFLTSGACR